MITIRCSKCKTKIIKYNKIGKGKVLKCYFARIKSSKLVRNGDEFYCECGNKIGDALPNAIKMNQNSFSYTGTIVNR